MKISHNKHDSHYLAHSFIGGGFDMRARKIFLLPHCLANSSQRDCEAANKTFSGEKLKLNACGKRASLMSEVRKGKLQIHVFVCFSFGATELFPSLYTHRHDDDEWKICKKIVFRSWKEKENSQLPLCGAVNHFVSYANNGWGFIKP